MLEKIKVNCDSCVHKEVCSHKKGFETVVNAISNTTVNDYRDNKTVMVPLENYEFIRDISISCKFYKLAGPTPRR